MARMPDGWVIVAESDKLGVEVRLKECLELVMRKNCKHWKEQSNDDKLGGFGICSNLGVGCYGNEFCSDGERRDT